MHRVARSWPPKHLRGGRRSAPSSCAHRLLVLAVRLRRLQHDAGPCCSPDDLSRTPTHGKLPCRAQRRPHPILHRPATARPGGAHLPPRNDRLPRQGRRANTRAASRHPAILARRWIVARRTARSAPPIRLRPPLRTASSGGARGPRCPSRPDGNAATGPDRRTAQTGRACCRQNSAWREVSGP